MKTVRKRRQARPAKLTQQEAERYRKMIEHWAQKAPSETGEHTEGMPKAVFTLSSGLGRAIYASYSDEDLLEVLRHTASSLGRAPKQSEVFSLYRIYLKARFGTWPAALRAAGMRQMPAPDLLLPDWVQMQLEEPEICEALQDVICRKHRLGYPPRKRDVPQSKILCERFRSWENVIAAADSFEEWQEERRTFGYK